MTYNWTPETLEEKYRENPYLARANKHPVILGDDIDINLAYAAKMPPQATASQPVARKAQTGNKYHVADKEDRTYNGRVYPSKKQATYAQQLDLLVKAGRMSFYLEEVPFRLPGGTVHRLDFIEFTNVFTGDFTNDGKPDFNWNIEFVEVKGRDLPLGKLKRKQTEELYGITIKVV